MYSNTFAIPDKYLKNKRVLYLYPNTIPIVAFSIQIIDPVILFLTFKR